MITASEMHQQFRDSIEAYLDASGLTPSAFGLGVLGDPGFVFDLREGRNCRSAVMDRVVEWMREHPIADEAAGD